MGVTVVLLVVLMDRLWGVTVVLLVVLMDRLWV